MFSVPPCEAVSAYAARVSTCTGTFLSVKPATVSSVTSTTTFVRVPRPNPLDALLPITWNAPGKPWDFANPVFMFKAPPAAASRMNFPRVRLPLPENSTSTAVSWPTRGIGTLANVTARVGRVS